MINVTLAHCVHQLQIETAEECCNERKKIRVGKARQHSQLRFGRHQRQPIELQPRRCNKVSASHSLCSKTHSVAHSKGYEEALHQLQFLRLGINPALRPETARVWIEGFVEQRLGLCHTNRRACGQSFAVVFEVVIGRDERRAKRDDLCNTQGLFDDRTLLILSGKYNLLHKSRHQNDADSPGMVRFRVS